ncbi:30S ribosomal protein S20 [candidate division WOR-3 bacterium]|jgi:small subunit ribosomal protein S20|nr:30S ribosomal protein S20 [candidate division WOR-3 bacterium]
MPNHKSCQKRMRQTAKRTLANKIIKTKVKTSIKKYLEESDKEKKVNLLKNIYKVYDQAVSKNVFKKNKAARVKSRLAKKLD